MKANLEIFKGFARLAKLTRENPMTYKQFIEHIEACDKMIKEYESKRPNLEMSLEKYNKRFNI